MRPTRSARWSRFRFSRSNLGGSSDVVDLLRVEDRVANLPKYQWDQAENAKEVAGHGKGLRFGAQNVPGNPIEQVFHAGNQLLDPIAHEGGANKCEDQQEKANRAKMPR